MVNKYKRKTSNASWDEGVMQLAMNEATKTSVNSAAKKYGINLSTLQRHIKKGCSKKKLGRFTTVFTPTQEEELIEYLFHMDNLFFGLNKKEFLELVWQYAEKNNISHRFKNGTAGEDWFKGFKMRHPDVSLRRPEPTSIARARGFNRPQVERFFNLLEEQIEKHNIDATRIYNVDETGIQTTSNKPPRVLTKTGKKQVGVISSVERGKLTTIVCCCNAAGSFVPPFLIFGRKRMVSRLLDGAPPGSAFSCTDNGWINGPTFLEWLRHFVEMTRPTQDKKNLLVMDNHESHKYLDALEFASKNHVIFISLAPHTTHRMQPLDTCVYRPLKIYFEQAVSVFQKTYVGRIISQYDVAKLFGEAYMKAASTHNAVKGFSSTGIWPPNRNIFDDSDYMPSTVTDRPEPVVSSEIEAAVANITHPAPAFSDIEAIATDILQPAPGLIDIEANVTDRPEPAPACENQVITVGEFDTANSHRAIVIDHTSLRQSIDSDRTISPSVLDELLYGRSEVCKTPAPIVSPVSVMQNSLKLVSPKQDTLLAVSPHVTPLNIRPSPKLQSNITTRKRKTQKAEILTSTPIKNEQRAKNLKKSYLKKRDTVKINLKEVKASTSRTIKKEKKKPKRGIKRSKTDPKEYRCLICCELYVDPPLEDWIMCDDCNLWAHESCTSYLGRGSYYCDICQE